MHDYFPNAGFSKVYNVNGVLYLIHKPVEIVNLEGENELGWDAANLNDNGSYHFFTESEIKSGNFMIQEF